MVFSQRLLLLLTLFLIGQTARANDYRTFATLAGRMSALARLLAAHSGLVSRYPTIGHSFFSPLQMAEYLGDVIPARTRPLPKRTVLRAERAGEPALLLEEVPAWVALFRGYVVDDTNARRFPSYALSPSSRVFWVLEDTPNAQPKAFVHSVMVTDTADGAKSPLVLQVAGELNEGERTLVEALVDEAHGSVPLFVGTRSSASAILPGNMAREIFQPLRRQKRTRVRFPEEWPHLSGMDVGQRGGGLEAFDAPFQASESRAAKLVTVERMDSIAVTRVEARWDYLVDVAFAALPTWERALLAASIYDERFYKKPAEGGTRFSSRIRFNRSRTKATVLPGDVPRSSPEAEEPDSPLGLQVPLVDIERDFVVTAEQMIAANRFRRSIRVFIHASEISGTILPADWRRAQKAGVQEADLYRLPRRALAESMVGLARAGLIDRTVALQRAPALWAQLWADLLKEEDKDRVLESLAYLLPLVPEHFEVWQAATVEHIRDPERRWHKLMSWAAEIGDLTLFDRVYALGATLSKPDRQRELRGTFGYACRGGEPSVIRRVRELLGKVDSDTLETGVQYASFTGQQGLVSVLLREGAFRGREPEVEVHDSALRGNGATLLEMLTERPQSPKQMDDLLDLALDAKDPDALAALLRFYPYSAATVDAARRRALDEGRELHLRYLLPTGSDGSGNCGVELVK